MNQALFNRSARKERRFVSFIAKFFVFAIPASLAAQTPMTHNTLTPEEKSAGWTLLFDGKSTKGWHTFNGKGVNPRWSVQNGELVLAPSPTRQISGADLETEEKFVDFELSLEWQMSPGGNSGIMYRVDGTGRETPWDSGPEYQLLDNGAVDDPPIHQAGSVWDLYAPSQDATRPVGQFNLTRIIVQKNRVEHWMNGVKLLSYELGSEDYERRRAKSAYARWPQFGAPKGTIVLQDEGRLMAFRNIKIRRLQSE